MTKLCLVYPVLGIWIYISRKPMGWPNKLGLRNRTVRFAILIPVTDTTVKLINIRVATFRGRILKNLWIKRRRFQSHESVRSELYSNGSWLVSCGRCHKSITVMIDGRDRWSVSARPGHDCWSMILVDVADKAIVFSNCILFSNVNRSTFPLRLRL